MTTPKTSIKDYGSKTTLTPPHTYQIPGGPYARKLGTTEIKVLSDIVRGSDEDSGYENKR